MHEHATGRYEAENVICLFNLNWLSETKAANFMKVNLLLLGRANTLYNNRKKTF